MKISIQSRLDIALEEAIHTAILTLKDSFEGELTEKNIEIGVLKQLHHPNVVQIYEVIVSVNKIDSDVD